MTAMPEQLALHGFDAPAPAVRPLAVHRRARRVLRSCCARGQAATVAVWSYLVDLALLDELRAQYRNALREVKRAARQDGGNLRGGRAAARFAASPEGRRYYRAIDQVSERVQAWENALCG
jgi:hypothetical protein